MSDEHWYEDETGSLVRPYTVTRGRTRPESGHPVDLMSHVTALDTDEPDPALDHGAAALLELIRRGPRPVVELAADTDLPLTVVRVLLGDLTEAGLIHVAAPRPGAPHGPTADPTLLREIAARLREL
ncbi:DUF742 domain-containing protein [Streptomyces sp. LP11]|uniref:DUF742 domain-containing protein n=1 Tax=Streptomyces pyxinicus TaxID=2970331 RepID=A0ABT2B7Z1_9ACTN|nr:DUF742 domain-containing protein [Streptomyces sp. LP11]MCS0604501.1 DUF742 domain-containing protein [Streptomyces sp. LP11]